MYASRRVRTGLCWQRLNLSVTLSSQLDYRPCTHAYLCVYGTVCLHITYVHITSSLESICHADEPSGPSALPPSCTRQHRRIGIVYRICVSIVQDSLGMRIGRHVCVIRAYRQSRYAYWAACMCSSCVSIVMQKRLIQAYSLLSLARLTGVMICPTIKILQIVDIFFMWCVCIGTSCPCILGSAAA